MTLRPLGAAFTALLLAGCAPELNWRDVRPVASAVQLQFPCRPALQERQLSLAGRAVRLTLHACNAGDKTWGLAQADIVDAERVGPALAELRAAAAANVGAAEGRRLALKVPGANPLAGNERIRLDGRLPDGRPVQMQVAVFAHGTQVYQATVLGERVGDDDAESYFGSIRFDR